MLGSRACVFLKRPPKLALVHSFFGSMSAGRAGALVRLDGGYDHVGPPGAGSEHAAVDRNDLGFAARLLSDPLTTLCGIGTTFSRMAKVSAYACS